MHPLGSPVVLLLLRPPPRSTLFPYTTLFRSSPPFAFSISPSQGDGRYRFWSIATDAAGNVESLAAKSPTGDAESDRKSTRLNSSHTVTSYAVFCLKKKNRVSTPMPARTGKAA